MSNKEFSLYEEEEKIISEANDFIIQENMNNNEPDPGLGDINANAEDIYGRTKFLGELQGPRAITLRKSTIGLELESSHGLIEWWLRQKGQIKGFNAAIYTGVITSELANIVLMLLQDYPELEGLYNVSSEPISKFKLLTELQSALNRKDIEILKDNDYIVITLTDNGTGIADTKKVMTPYFTTKKKGTGLGLPIVSKIISEHSGELSISKDKKEGVEISILLPEHI